MSKRRKTPVYTLAVRVLWHKGIMPEFERLHRKLDKLLAAQRARARS